MAPIDATVSRHEAFHVHLCAGVPSSNAAAPGMHRALWCQPGLMGSLHFPMGSETALAVTAPEDAAAVRQEVVSLWLSIIVPW